MRKNGIGKYYRSVKTKSEIRESFYDEDGLIRPKRKKLPSSYDDVCISRDTSWKNFRKSKYQVDAEELLIAFESKCSFNIIYSIYDSLRRKGYHVDRIDKYVFTDKIMSNRMAKARIKYPQISTFFAYKGKKIRLCKGAYYV